MGHMRTEVKIAELKSKLSHYLRHAQKGNEIVIKDRDTPIARLTGYQGLYPLIPATIAPRELKKIKSTRPKKLRTGDGLRALMEERKERF